MQKYGESKTTRIMMANVCNVTSSSGLKNFRVLDYFEQRVQELCI